MPNAAFPTDSRRSQPFGNSKIKIMRQIYEAENLHK